MMKNKYKMGTTFIVMLAMVSYLKAQNTEIDFDGKLFYTDNYNNTEIIWKV